MRSLIVAALLGLAAVLASPLVGQAREALPGPAAVRGHGPSAAAAVSLAVTAGYQNQYRDTAWTPIRVTLRNRSGSDIVGTLQLPQSGSPPSMGPAPSFHGLYEAPV